MTAWTSVEIVFLKNNYPEKGREFCAKALNRTLDQIRAKTWRLKLKQNRESDFFKDWQKRAATSKIGKKRPAQGDVLKAVWASGKLATTPERRKASSVAMKKRIAEKGHNRGMLGKTHSDENKAKFSAKSLKMWKIMTDEQKMEIKKKMIHTRIINGTYAPYRVECTWKAAWREFGGRKHFYRSRWEANYGRYLEFLKCQGKIKEWAHEPDVFWFEGVKRGCVSYLPDFKVINNDDSIEYHEVKGWMDARSRTKIKRMAKYHPKIKLIVIKKKEYTEILTKLSKIIPDWE